jgi:hypothetical protein
VTAGSGAVEQCTQAIRAFSRLQYIVAAIKPLTFCTG